MEMSREISGWHCAAGTEQNDATEILEEDLDVPVPERSRDVLSRCRLLISEDDRAAATEYEALVANVPSPYPSSTEISSSYSVGTTMSPCPS